MNFLLYGLLCVMHSIVFTEAEFNESSHENRSLRMIGGTSARIKDHPYQVSLKWTFNGTRHFCGGSMVSERQVVTAAHCLDDKLDYPSYISVISGTRRSDIGGRAHAVKSITMHPDYKGESDYFLNDIAVVTLSEPIKFTSTQQPIELPARNVVSGTVATITGWGYTSLVNDTTPAYLQKATVPVYAGEECQDWLENTQICGIVPAGTGVCTGDSGGPLVANGQLVGVISYANQMCGRGLLDIYTNVYRYVDFIKSIIRS